MKLCGKNPVFERLRTNPQSIRKIYLQEGFKETDYVRKKAKQHNKLLLVVPKSKIQKIARNTNTQGILADVDPYPYEDYRDVLDQCVKKKITLVYLDGLTDPQNFGAIIRSLGCLGRFALIIPTHKSVEVTEAVLRVASGGDNHIIISQVANLGKAIRKAKSQGFWIVGANANKGESIDGITFRYPLGVVIGSEGEGIRDIHQKLIDQNITVPMSKERMSFNVAIATSIICYEIAKQKKA